MCKTPVGDGVQGCKCEPAEAAEGDNAAAVEEEQAASDNDSDWNDLSDSLLDSSSDDEDDDASDSDAESASGNRVTTDMVVWYMLKEHGLISEEKYKEKADMHLENIKSLIPKIPGSDSSHVTDEERDISGSFAFDTSTDKIPKTNGESLLDKLFEEIQNEKETKDKRHECPENEGIVKDSSNMEGVENSNSVNNENVSNISTVISKELSTEIEVVVDIVPMETSNNELTQQPHTENNNCKLIQGNQQLPCGDIIVPESTIMDTENESLKSQTQEEDINKENKNILNGVETERKNIETVNNEDTAEKGDHIEIADTKAPKTVNKESTGSNQATTSQGTNRETKSFKYILKKLAKEKRIRTDYAYVDVLETYVTELDGYYKKNRAVELFDTPINELKEFAAFLNFYSHSSYKHILETYNTPLPNLKVLSSWYMKDDDQPGLSKRAFDILKQKASKKRLTCALMSRDIYLKNFSLNYDQVDYGGGCNYEYTDKAVIVFAFVLVSLDEDWKMPIGYILADEMPAESQAGLIKVCLMQCHDAGVDVVAITLESPSPAEFLGCSFQDIKNLKTTFKHPECERDVAVWIDPCLALRSARHTLNASNELLDETGGKIRWSLIKKLRNLYSDDSIDFNKPEFLKLRNYIAKVNLTTEIFSESLVPALELCEKLLPDSFQDTAPTRRYIEMINGLYDILNSMKISNLGDVETKLNDATEYLTSLFSKEGNRLSRFDKQNLASDKRLEFRSFVGGKPVCGFIAFLISIASFKHLVNTLVDKEHRLDCLNTHRLCKDHAEDFVKNIRAYDRVTLDNFTGFNFQCFYDRLFDDLEKNPHFSDKNVSLDQWSLKNKHSPALTIKLTSGKRAYDEVYSHQYAPKKLKQSSHHNRATKLVREYSNAMDVELDLSKRKNMVGYLAAWIVTKFAKCLKCEACIDALYTDKKQWFHKFITLKDIKGVCLPSEEVFRICWECERALREKGSPARLRAWVLRRLASRFPWSTRQAKHHPTHYVLLVRAIIAKYIPLRVTAPFSTKEKKKIQQMFTMFSSLSRCGLLGYIRGED